MEDSGKVSKYRVFMEKENLKKLLNVLCVQASVITFKRKFIFSKEEISKKHTYNIYYTPIKGIIRLIDIDGKDYKMSDIILPFKIGDNISLATKWASDNKYEVLYNRKRKNNI
jgi:hypothetical protein